MDPPNPEQRELLRLGTERGAGAPGPSERDRRGDRGPYAVLGERDEHLERRGAEWWLRHRVAVAVCPRACFGQLRRGGARERWPGIARSSGDPEWHGHG